jgi:VIT1/CCC1 family predicted Fe2+/Mn2+ transporter
VIDPEDHRGDRSRALASSSIVVAFFLFSQLVIVPVLDGRSPASQAVPASVVAVLMFVVTYLVSATFQKRRRRRSRD